MLSIDPMLITAIDQISIRAVHDLLEVRTIDAHNQRIVDREREKEAMGK